MFSNAAHVNAPSLNALNSILVISPRSLQAVNSFPGASVQIHLRARNTRTSATISTNPNIHIQPLCQPLKREHRRRFHFRHAYSHSAHAFAFLHCGIGRLPKYPPGIAEVVPTIVQPRLVDEVEGKVSPSPIVIHDGSLLESTGVRPPHLCQWRTQIFAAESGDLHFVQRHPVKAFVLPIQVKFIRWSCGRSRK